MKKILVLVLAVLIVLAPMTFVSAQEGEGAETASQQNENAFEMAGDTIAQEEQPEVLSQAEEQTEASQAETEGAAIEEPLHDERPDEVRRAEKTYIDLKPGEGTPPQPAQGQANVQSGGHQNWNYLEIYWPSDRGVYTSGDEIEICVDINTYLGSYFELIVVSDSDWMTTGRLPFDGPSIYAMLWDTTMWDSGTYMIYATTYYDGYSNNEVWYDFIYLTLNGNHAIDSIYNFVDRLYSMVLERSPDGQGSSDWTNLLYSKGITGADAAYGFFFSPEMKGRNLSNDAYVEVLYKTLMNRPSDPGGKAGWVGALNGGALREQVFAGFVNSAEFEGLCNAAGIDRGYFDYMQPASAAGGVRAFVGRLYKGCLGRAADSQGISDWMNLLSSGQISGTMAAHGFFFSQEMDDRALEDMTYVEVLYRVFMGRGPDSDGWHNWMEALDDGASREEVFYGFANSAEFAAICASYGIRVS